MSTLGMDIVIGLRSFRKSPIIILAALLSLAMGISANSLIFSVVNALVLHPLPFHNPDKLMVLWQNRLQDIHEIDDTAPANFVDWTQQNRSFESLAAYTASTFDITDEGRPEEVIGTRVTANFFDTLQISPASGRFFAPEETSLQSAPVVVISNGLWKRRFGSGSVIGKSLRLNGLPYSIVGVAPPGWFLIAHSDLWVPMGWDNASLKRDDHYLSVIGRLKPDTTPTQATNDMRSVAQRLANIYPKENSGYSVLVRPVGDVYPSERDRRLILILMAAVGFVLLIACSNVANLQLARASARSRDAATRAALGASRSALIRQYLTESILLGLLGGILGVAFCFIGLQLLSSSVAFGNYWNPIKIDPTVLVFTFIISVLSGIVFGIMPAFQASKPNLRQIMDQGNRGSSGASRKMGRTLVIVEVTLTVALLVIGGDIIRDFVSLRTHNPGFNASGLVTMRVSLPIAKYGKGQFSKDQVVSSTLDLIAESLKSLPGVRDVSYVTILPRSESDPKVRFTLPEQRLAQGGMAPIASWRAVGTNYFSMMGVPLLQGREFTSNDRFGSDPVIIVSESLAKKIFPGQDPVGKQLFFFDTARRIVGVVSDVLLTRSLDAPPCIYLPHPQSPRLTMSFLVRVSGDPAALISRMPDKVWAVDADQPVSNLLTYEAYQDLQFAGRRLTTDLLAIFCVLAVIMAAIGLYGLISYLVVQRTTEFGIRLALGAPRTNIFLVVMKEGMLICGIGMALGVLAIVPAKALLGNVLGTVSSIPWIVPALTMLLIGTVGALASVVPATRATSVEPATALREG